MLTLNNAVFATGAFQNRISMNALKTVFLHFNALQVTIEVLKSIFLENSTFSKEIFQFSRKISSKNSNAC